MTPRGLRVYDTRTGRIVLDVAAEHSVDDVVFGSRGDSMLTLGPGSGERRGRALPVWALGHGDRVRDSGVVVAAESIEFGGAGDGVILLPKEGGGFELRDPITGARRGPVRDDRDLLKAAAARLGPGGYRTLVLAPDGHTLGIGDSKGDVSVMDIRDRLGGKAQTLHRQRSRATSLAFDPGSHWIASAGFGPDSDVIVQRTDGKSPPILVTRNLGKVERLQFVGGERWLRVNDTVWDTERRAPVVDLGGQGTRLSRLEIDPLGDAAAWLFRDASVRLATWGAPGLVAQTCALVLRNLTCGEWRRLYGAEPYRRTCEAFPGPEGSSGPETC